MDQNSAALNFKCLSNEFLDFMEVQYYRVNL